MYKQLFTNSYMQIEVCTNSSRVHTLVGNFLDFDTTASHASPRIKIRFYLDEVDGKLRSDKKNYVCETASNNGEMHTASFGSGGAQVITDYSTATVRAVISGYEESLKERFLQFMFTLPLQRILAHHGFFFLHASMVQRLNRCVLICGPAASGKSTLALAFSRHGFSPLSDDDCFIKVTRNGARAFPFPTKIGLNERVLKSYPELAQYAVKGFRYYGKRRIPLYSVAHHNKSAVYKCTAIIFPRYGNRGEVSLKAISKEEALRGLLKCTFVRLYPDKEEEVLWTFYTFAQKIPSFRLIYNDGRLDEIPALIDEITEQ